MVRLVAILSVAGGVAGFLLYLHLLGKGPFATLEGRHLRQMKDRTSAPDSVEPFTHDAFFALPRGLSVAEYSGIERRAVSLEGQVHHLLRATDGDFHADLYPVARAGSEVAMHAVTTEITPQWHGSGLDGWGFERLAAIFRPERGTVAPWEGGPVRVRLSGWLLYDHADDALPRPPGAPHALRLSQWEIHPVTKIERWDSTHAGWVEVKR